MTFSHQVDMPMKGKYFPEKKKNPSKIICWPYNFDFSQLGHFISVRPWFLLIICLKKG